MFAIWRPQRPLTSSQHCNLCRASTRCFSHSLEDAKRQVEPRQEALWQLHFQIFPDYDFVPFFSTIRTSHSGMEEEGLFFCSCRCCQVPGSSLKEAQYVNDGGLVSLISRPHPEWECLPFGGHSDRLLLRSIATFAGLRQDVSHILWRMPNVKLSRDKRRFGNCTSRYFQIMTLYLSSQQSGHHTLAWKRRAYFSAAVDVVKCQAPV